MTATPYGFQLFLFCATISQMSMQLVISCHVAVNNLQL